MNIDEMAIDLDTSPDAVKAALQKLGLIDETKAPVGITRRGNAFWRKGNGWDRKVVPLIEHLTRDVPRAPVKDEVLIPARKTCSGCGKEKSNQDFRINGTRADGLTAWCTDCMDMSRH